MPALAVWGGKLDHMRSLAISPKLTRVQDKFWGPIVIVILVRPAIVSLIVQLNCFFWIAFAVTAYSF
jgi:hypothetical protein